MINKKNILIILGILCYNLVFPQNSFRIMTYNVLNYPSKISSTRNPYFNKIISEIKPDILIVQEMESIAGVSLFHEQVLDTSFTAGAFINGNDTDNALFFKHDKFMFIENIPIKTPLRDISKLTLVHKISNDTLIIFSAHLKASSGTTNEQKRLAEVNRLRTVTNQLPPNTNYLLVGDFNFYSASEPGFQALINKTNSGYFLDPINKIGTWHNSNGYRITHTQSTRLVNLSDEGSTGGLDDRFDMILVSQSIFDTSGITYITNSYTSFGNDGNHFNRAMIELPNSSVSDEIAKALYYASDHLPVYADFSFQELTSVDSKYTANYSKFELLQNYPNPFNPNTIINYSVPISNDFGNSFVNLTIYNAMGEKVHELINSSQPAGNYTVEFNGSKLSSGIYFYSLRIGKHIITKKMLLLR